jgi:succinate dehydrogenase hydrophobic anchor subunit
MRSVTQSRTAESAWLWLAKLVTGAAILAILIIHLIVNHLVAAGGLLTYADVLAYYANPIIPVMEAFFLIFVISHALLGVRSIVLDLGPAAHTRWWLDRALVVVGASAISYGLWLLVVLAERARG